jgi:hypothetical protein
MRIHTKIAMLAATLAVGAAPALAMGPPSGTPIPTNSGTSHMPANPGSQGGQGTSHKPSTPGPNASLPAKARAYGRYCQNESKQHVAGTPGTPFSKCVSDMAKLASGSTKSPRAACENESKRHVAGQKGTPFSECVSGGAKVLENQASSSSSSTSSSSS